MNESDNLDKIYNMMFKRDTNKIIFVYTPPKVGSTTLVTSLRISLAKTASVIHIHDEIMLSVLTGVHNVKIMDIIKYAVAKGKRVYIIDIYRNPIERRMSEYFYKLNSLHFNNTPENMLNYNVNRLNKRFNDIFPYLSLDDYYLNTFGQYTKPFNFDKKYILDEINGAIYLKIRLNDVSMWDSILSEILSERVVLVNDCITEQMVIGELYKKLKESYRIPYNLLELIKNDKAFNFFCSEQERIEYINKWLRKSCFEYKTFTREQYDMYLMISLENQYHEKIEEGHYLDNGCYCKACIIKRREIYFKALKKEEITERICHNTNVSQMKEKNMHMRNDKSLLKCNIYNIR